MSNRAYALLEIKAVSEGADKRRRFSGIATTVTADRMGDIVEPKGAMFRLPIPLLWQHNAYDPIGWVHAARVTDKGIEVEGEVADCDDEGELKARLAKAWQMLKAKLVRGLSIGFNSIESTRIDQTYSRRFIKWEWLELSAVTIPANAEATITAIKSADTLLLSAALGRGAADGRHTAVATLQQQGAVGRDAQTLPGASGASARKGVVSLLTPKGRTDMKTLEQQIADLKVVRQEKGARMQALMQKAGDEGRSLDADEANEFDEHGRDIKRIDEDLARCEMLAAINVARAAPVLDRGADTQRTNVLADAGADPAAAAKAAAARTPHISVRSNLPKGTGFVRFVQAIARTKGNLYEAYAHAQANPAWKDTPEVALVLKAASDAGTTTDTDWASKLVYYENMASEFVELLRPMMILGKFGANGIPPLRRVPMNVRMATQTGGGTYRWVGEGAAKPVGELVIGEITLRWAKASGIIVISDELARTSTPSAEAVVRQDMLAGMAQFLDLQFVNPDVGEVTNVSPASVFQGVTPVTATGTTADALRDDIKTLLGNMFAANHTPTTGVWIMSNRQALGISLMRNALGQKEYPDVTAMGGTLEGFPVIASENVPDDSNGGMIGFVNANDIYFSDDGPVTIDASREATLQMNTTPDEPTAASTVLVSLWQRNLIGLKAERYANWKKRRSTAAQYISGANYG